MFNRGTLRMKLSMKGWLLRIDLGNAIQRRLGNVVLVVPNR